MTLSRRVCVKGSRPLDMVPIDRFGFVHKYLVRVGNLVSTWRYGGVYRRYVWLLNLTASLFWNEFDLDFFQADFSSACPRQMAKRKKRGKK